MRKKLSAQRATVTSTPTCSNACISEREWLRFHAAHSQRYGASLATADVQHYMEKTKR